MRIVQLTPGTGNFHCGNCIRDHALTLALRKLGHDVLMVPMYLPHVLDNDAALPGGSEDPPLFFGGINVYLQHKLPLFRRTPRWIDRLFNNERLLRWAARRSSMTTAHDLGSLTVDMLRGEQGTQNKELSKLITWMRTQGKVDLVVLSNALLVGLARRLRRELNTAVVCTMAGEDAFLDDLDDPWRSESWRILTDRAREVDRFIAVSDYYGALMAERLKIAVDRISTIYNGIDLDGYEPAERPADPPTIGFLSRLCHGKGLGTLIDAFIEMKQRDRIPNLKLLAVGAATPGDQPFIVEQRNKLAAAGVLGDVEWHQNVTHSQKQQLLRRMTVLSVPTTYGESFGLYVLEALASGVPVVLPRRGAFPELVDQLGGGLLVEPDLLDALADGLEIMILRGEEASKMALNARQRILQRFSAETMAQQAASVYQQALSGEVSHAV